jgi:hypothetical protein
MLVFVMDSEVVLYQLIYSCLQGRLDTVLAVVSLYQVWSDQKPGRLLHLDRPINQETIKV